MALLPLVTSHPLKIEVNMWRSFPHLPVLLLAIVIWIWHEAGGNPWITLALCIGGIVWWWIISWRLDR